MHCVIFVGIQASGKTAFYKERFFETHIRISLDMLKSRHRENLLVASCIAARQPFVVDNTNVLASERAFYIPPAKQAGFKVTGYFFRTPVKAAIARNARRADKKPVPIPGLLGKFKRLEPPALHEGFDEIFAVELTPAGEFAISAYVPGAPEG